MYHTKSQGKADQAMASTYTAAKAVESRLYPTAFAKRALFLLLLCLSCKLTQPVAREMVINNKCLDILSRSRAYSSFFTEWLSISNRITTGNLKFLFPIGKLDKFGLLCYCVKLTKKDFLLFYAFTTSETSFW